MSWDSLTKTSVIRNKSKHCLHCITLLSSSLSINLSVDTTAGFSHYVSYSSYCYAVKWVCGRSDVSLMELCDESEVFKSLAQYSWFLLLSGTMWPIWKVYKSKFPLWGCVTKSIQHKTLPNQTAGATCCGNSLWRQPKVAFMNPEFFSVVAQFFKM